MRVDIRPSCLRDASYVMANMRPEDEREIMCQVPTTAKRHELAHWLISVGDSFVAYADDVPAMLVGTNPINVACLSVWAIGTPKARRVVPDVTRFMIQEYLPSRVAEGYHTMEARSIVGHHQAHRWMKATGAVVSGEPFVYGRDREKFLLFRWDALALPAAAKRYGA